MSEQQGLPGVPQKTEPRRPRPYVWVSWLTKLLAGEEKCWWKAWYKAHFKFSRQPDDPDREEFFREWNEKHDAITNRRAETLREEGWIVRVEEDASFKLAGRGADLAGKPDLVAVKGDQALVIDAKSGRRRSSDHWQVLIYMFSLPISWLGERIGLRGEVAYRDGDEAVRPLGEKERTAIIGAISLVSADVEPPRMPSLHECSRCDVAACPDRVRSQGGDATRYF